MTVEPTADAGGKYRNWNGYTGTLAYGWPLAYRLTCFISPRSSYAVTSSSTGSAGVAWKFSSGYLKPSIVGAVVSAVVGSR